MKGTEMVVGRLELKPQRIPIWAWLRLCLSPKGDRAKTETVLNKIRAIVI